MRKEVITFRDPKSPVSEVFRTLRTNIQFLNSRNSLKSVLVTSTSPAEGKSWVTANLAVTFAQAGKKVVLIDCDMRKGRQFAIFGVQPTPGISNYLSGIDSAGGDSSSNILSYVKETEIQNLYLIPAGNVPPNPSELLTSSKLVQALKQLKEVCDLIIIDGTPSDLVTDAVILSRYVDSTIIVAAYKTTKIEALEKVKKEIQNVGGKIAGVVINKMPISTRKYYGTYYYGSTNMPMVKRQNNKKIIEENIRIQKEKDKQRAEAILKQNREEKNNNLNGENKNSRVSSIYDFEKDEPGNSNKKGFENPEDVMKQMNDYLSEQKKQLKKED